VPENVELARVFFTHYSQGRLEELAALLHPDVVVAPAAEPQNELRGRNAVYEFLQSQTARRFVYEIQADRYTPVGDRWVIVEGRGRFSDLEPTGGFHDRSMVWLAEFGDDLLVRSETFDTVEAARAAAAERATRA
jgi:ketosteroid isomerase-like protein